MSAAKGLFKDLPGVAKQFDAIIKKLEAHSEHLGGKIEKAAALEQKVMDVLERLKDGSTPIEERLQLAYNAKEGKIEGSDLISQNSSDLSMSGSAR